MLFKNIIFFVFKNKKYEIIFNYQTCSIGFFVLKNRKPFLKTDIK